MALYHIGGVLSYPIADFLYQSCAHVLSIEVDEILLADTKRAASFRTNE